MRRRHLVPGLLFAALSCSSASAADVGVPVYPRVVPVVTPLFNWTGIYSASSIGFSWVDIHGAFVLPPPDHFNNAITKRWITGSAIGAQLQVLENWVVGVEGSYNSFLHNPFTDVLSGADDCLKSKADLLCESRVRSFWTVGGKLGYSFSSFLLYGTGGYANGKIETQTVGGNDQVVDATEARHGGWFAGAGLEVFVTRLWFSDLILGIDYKHVALEPVRHFDNTGALNASTRDMQAEVDAITFRIVSKY